MVEIICRTRKLLVPDDRMAVMGILNAAPDSFSDGVVDLEQRIRTLVSDKPDLIDIGGESTRPGAQPVDSVEEIKRVVPVICRVRELLPDVVISVDTRKSEVAEAALLNGADIINDVSALRYDPEIVHVAADFSAGLILNHSRGVPETMNQKVFSEYPGGVGKNVALELQKSIDFSLASGIKKESLILDPGLGFAKNTEQNLSLLAGIDDLKVLGYPLLSGPSRKRFIGELTGESDPLNRDFGTCGAVIASLLAGYSIVRVHNVKAVKDCLSVFMNCRKCGNGGV